MVTPGQHMGMTHVDEGALKWLQGRFGASSLVDVGCGPGWHAQAAADLGYRVTGIDGDPGLEFVDTPFVTWVRHDFEHGPLCIPHADVAWCVEVAEHIGTPYIGNLLDSLACADKLIITWAPPGHGGIHHVNEQPTATWIEDLMSRGWEVRLRDTQDLRSASTMNRNFIRHRGWLLSR